MDSELRSYFPQIAKSDYIYFDNAATTAKPQSVLKVLNDYYLYNNANIHSGIYNLAYSTTKLFEGAREKVAKYFNAKTDEIVFTRGATESINFIASGCEWDEVFVCITEHHSNMLPWREVCANTHFIYCDKSGNYDLDKLHEILQNHEGRAILALSAHSNVFGKNPQYEKMCEIAKMHGVYTALDATQAIPHSKINTRNRQFDFIAGSGHKIYGPMGIGILYINKRNKNMLKPTQLGGGCVESVTENDYTLPPCPYCFEAGTMNVGGAIGLGVAIDYLDKHSNEIKAREDELSAYAYNTLLKIQHVNIISKPRDVIISFTVDGVHPHDVAHFLNQYKIYVRAGYHCAQPGLDYLQIGPVTRVSLSFYNTKTEIDVLAAKLADIRTEMKLDV